MSYDLVEPAKLASAERTTSPDRPVRLYAERVSDRKPKRILVSGGRIVGYELSDGTVVPPDNCCDDPLACEREECWKPRPWPWPRAPDGTRVLAHATRDPRDRPFFN